MQCPNNVNISGLINFQFKTGSWYSSNFVLFDIFYNDSGQALSKHVRLGPV